MSLVFACIAPHGDVDLAPELRAGDGGARPPRSTRREPDVAVVVTPHSVHVEGHFAVVTSAKVGEWETDRALRPPRCSRRRCRSSASRTAATTPPTAEFPLDWGTEVPLDVRAARRGSSSSRRRATGRSRSTSGSARRSRALPGRVALIASADHGHAHDADGPYGFDPAAAEYDALLQEILASDRLDFLPLAELVEPAKADSLWQLLVLQGAVGEAARADVLAYAAPTYYGMLVAEVTV